MEVDFSKLANAEASDYYENFSDALTADLTARTEDATIHAKSEVKREVGAVLGNLRNGIKDFKSEEKKRGPAPKTWQKFESFYNAIKKNLSDLSKLVGKDKKDGRDASDGEIATTVNMAISNFERGWKHFRDERRELIERDEKMTRDMGEIRESLEKAKAENIPESSRHYMKVLEKNTEVMLNLSETIREYVRQQSARENPQETQKIMEDARARIEGAKKEIVPLPARIKEAVRSGVYKAVDGVLSKTVGVVEKYNESLREDLARGEKLKQAILNKSPFHKKENEAAPKRRRRIVKLAVVPKKDAEKKNGMTM